jgi:hypothetical protein
MFLALKWMTRILGASTWATKRPKSSAIDCAHPVWEAYKTWRKGSLMCSEKNSVLQVACVEWARIFGCSSDNPLK